MFAAKTIWYGNPASVPVTKEVNGVEVTVMVSDPNFDRRVKVIGMGEEIPAELLEHKGIRKRMAESGLLVRDIDAETKAKAEQDRLDAEADDAKEAQKKAEKKAQAAAKAE